MKSKNNKTMEAQELRIGNYLHDAKGKLAIVEGLSKDNIKAYSGMVTPLPLKPIPLTEQWLIDFGFKLFPWGYVLDGILIRHINKPEEKFWIEMGNGKRIELPYVHSVQNTYFCIEQKELTK